ncbi:reverse transcriptase domain-containing protein [Tanacetum coccineum]
MHHYQTKPEELPEPWTLFTDGSSCVDGSGAGLILTNAEGAEFTYAMRFRFEATNNEAEYEALIAGLRIAEQMGVKNLQAHVDSRLVANQVNGSYVAKESGMIQYLNKVKMLARSFREFSIKQVPQSENKKADALSKIASTSFAHLSKQEILPADKKKARAVRRKAARYTMINGTLYKKSFLGPWLRGNCIKQWKTVLRQPIQRLVRKTMYPSKNDEALEINLDLIEEKREQAAIQEAKGKTKMEKYYNSRVRDTSFKPGNMVYRSNDASHARDGGKLGPKWEGPYEVAKSLGKGAYKLKDYKGNELPRTWNICNLKKCYIHEM